MWRRRGGARGWSFGAGGVPVTTQLIDCQAACYLTGLPRCLAGFHQTVRTRVSIHTLIIRFKLFCGCVAACVPVCNARSASICIWPLEGVSQHGSSPF